VSAAIPGSGDGPRDAGAFAPSLVAELALARPATPVLSAYVRTDPRDPANTNHVPGWLVELRNGLRTIGDRLDRDGPRSERLAYRGLRTAVEADIVELEPSERARGVAWFRAVDGTIDRRLRLQLPPRETSVRWDARPFVSPLADVADRGRATGLVLVAQDRVRLLHWEAGLVSEPHRSLYELELGDWREYAAYAMANPARGQQTATNTAVYDARVEEWQGRFLRETAKATTSRIGELGWRRLVLAGELTLVEAFADALPPDVGDRVVARVAANLLAEDAPVVADRLEAELEATWRAEADDAVARAVGAARAGGPGATGLAEVADALAQHRVEHLVLDPLCAFDPAGIPPTAWAALGGAPAELVAERAVELAIASGAGVTALAAAESERLQEAGGMVAALRF